MTIKIESIINQWDSETNDVIVRFLNLLTLAKTRKELELALDFTSVQGAVQETPPMGMGKQTPLGETSLPLQRQRSREQITDC